MCITYLTWVLDPTLYSKYTITVTSMNEKKENIDNFMQKKWNRKSTLKNRWALYSMVILIIGISALLGVFRFLDTGKMAPSSMKGNDMNKAAMEKEIITVNPQERKNANSLLLIGEVRSNDVAKVYARREGIVKDIYVDIGDTVEAGEVIGTLFPRGVEGQSDDIIYEAQKKKELAEVIVESREELADAAVDAAEEKDLSSEEEELVDEEQDFLEESARASLEVAQANLEKEILVQGHTRLISPFSGVIAKRYISVGEDVSPKKPAFDLVDVPTHLAIEAKSEIEFGLPEDLGDALTIDDEVVFFVGAEMIDARVAKVSRMSPQIDEMTRQFTVRAAIADGDSIPHGSTVRVRLESSEPQIYRIPSSSIKRLQDENFVWIINDSETPQRLQIDILGDDGEFAEVSGRIDESSRIVKRLTEKMMEEYTEMVDTEYEEKMHMQEEDNMAEGEK